MRGSIVLGSSGTVDLTEDISMPLTFSVADIREPEKRNASYSKTISIPGSKNNDKLFGHIFEIDIDGSFNPNIKTPATIYIDEIEQITGFLRLLKINRNDKNKIMYEVAIIGDVGNMFTTLADSLLTDLDLSDYDHTYTKAVQKTSWTAPVGTGYVYPMIDYGLTNGLTYDVVNFFPAIYVKQYIDKIFNYAGYSYTSTFFNSDFFKHLIIPYSGSGLSYGSFDITPRLFSIGSTGGQTIAINTSSYTIPEAAPLKLDDDAVIDGFLNDAYNSFNTTIYKWVVPNTGNYGLFSSTTLKLSAAGVASGQVVILIERAGVVSLIGVSATTSINAVDVGISLNINVGLLAGDKVFMGVRVKSTFGDTTLDITDVQLFNTVNNTGLFDGNSVSMNTAIPAKIKQKDFLLSIVKMFNLYIETDKDYSNKLYIEPRNDFYLNGKTKDWTSKLDNSQDLEIIPMGQLNSRSYSYTYSEDGDYYNKIYKDSFQEAYGRRFIDSGNEFVKGTNETKIIFSPTPLVDSNSHNRVISVIDQDGADIVSDKPGAFNIRILYYGGLVSCNAWTYTGNVSGSSSETSYPYAGHLDSVSAPTLDLLFGVPREVYYKAAIYTNNNLYNKYHRQFLEEITDKDSKIVTGYFHLTPVDKMDLDFRDQFFVDGHFLRLNKIEDYDPLISKTTKCEFIKIKNTNAFVAHTTSSNGGGNVIMNSLMDG